MQSKAVLRSIQLIRVSALAVAAMFIVAATILPWNHKHCSSVATRASLTTDSLFGRVADLLTVQFSHPTLTVVLKSAVRPPGYGDSHKASVASICGEGSPLIAAARRATMSTVTVSSTAGLMQALSAAHAGDTI